MDLSNKTIPVLRPTKIQPPRSRFDRGGLGADGHTSHAQMQMPPHAVPYSAVHNRISAFPQAPFVVVGQSDDGPAIQPASQQALPMQPAQPQSTGFGAFGPPAPAGAFGSSTQTAPPPPPLFGSVRNRSLEVPMLMPMVEYEWQDFQNISAPEDEEEQMNAIGEPTSVVHESPLALTYHVEGASGVPSDGVPHQVTIAVLPFEAKIQHVTVPKVRPVAYLQATVKNTSDYRLLPGTVHAFVDDSFVSKTGIVGDVAPGDVFSCTLGADPATRIRYARTWKRADDDTAGGAAGRERSAFSEQWAAAMYRSRTTVTNRHPFALLELVVRDGVPVCEDEKRVSVVLRHPAGLAELEQGKELQVGAKEDEGDGESEGKKQKKQKVRWCKVVDGKGGRKEGLFEWVVEVGAGEKLTIETEWDVKAPVSLKWIEST